MFPVAVLRKCTYRNFKIQIIFFLNKIEIDHYGQWQNGKIANTCILEMAHRRMKGSEIWDSGEVVQHVWGSVFSSVQCYFGVN